MKLRECIEAIEEYEECSRQNAIFEFLNGKSEAWEDHYYGTAIYYYPDIDYLRYEIFTKGVLIQAFKLKNKFERRLIKLAERMENNNAI